LGDPKFEIKVEKCDLLRASIKANRRNQLALNLLDMLFEPGTLSISTVKGTRDGTKQQLDPAKIEAIKVYCLEKFPVQSGESIKEALQKLVKALTDKCLAYSKAA
jgi:hypothetical protein